MSSHLHHLALGAQDVEALSRWYESVFQLKRLTEHHNQDGSIRSIWLRLGSQTVLMIEKSEAPPRAVDGIGTGPFLLAFHVHETAKSSKLKELSQRGIELEDATSYTTYFRDPEGNRVALSHYPLEDLA